MQFLCVFTSDLVIVMDKPLLESGPRECNTESYSRSLHHLQPWKIFVGKIFVKFLLLQKLRNFSTTKIWCYTVDSIFSREYAIYMASHAALNEHTYMKLIGVILIWRQ